ncbi:TIGR03757 family integrating conjugative element protein [Xenorhabdus griffiniae]|uniref:TIGR03757 family integrating conjugative element protein n=1 Tax=Xenorhabdus griffiniae TaxID=351672 RepID=A0ABY9XEU8_9GAMM|nr:TIGR03757 family integrating conjugative element protein [Xenorhabdus griffiniae]MBD1226009.1 TIGR03757 family integrating conjugative element protein [Xenorhabdus griffiniae]MBE8585873.1 TIGR03757 family integrating conjugative element protein [Xenorhabdus griffiniae]WMV71419.1 TIGR03757 family integrating conjugative element protein [Xenorhabdus griffiniae]WNH01096.1 TIGR03757 family integrating conjugative element protein [Xenorhabdus griffiniae]
MKMLVVFIVIALTSIAQASTVIYTDHENPPSRNDFRNDIQVVWLDAPDMFSENWFNTMNISVNTSNSSLITELLQSPEWREKEKDMVIAYQGVIRAWELGIKKYPAIVIDDRYVVYGSTDATRAQILVDTYRRRNN